MHLLKKRDMTLEEKYFAHKFSLTGKWDFSSRDLGGNISSKLDFPSVLYYYLSMISARQVSIYQWSIFSSAATLYNLF